MGRGVCENRHWLMDMHVAALLLKAVHKITEEQDMYWSRCWKYQYNSIYLYDTIGTLSNLTGTCPCYSTANTTESAMYAGWISGCKSLQPKAWFPTRRRSSFDPQVGGSNYSYFQLYLEWWYQFMVYCSLYNICIYIYIGMGWNHQQLNGMAWLFAMEFSSTKIKTTHGIFHTSPNRPLTNHICHLPCRTTLQHFGRNFCIMLAVVRWRCYPLVNIQKAIENGHL